MSFNAQYFPACSLVFDLKIDGEGGYNTETTKSLSTQPFPTFRGSCTTTRANSNAQYFVPRPKENACTAALPFFSSYSHYKNNKSIGLLDLLDVFLSFTFSIETRARQIRLKR